MINIAYYFLLPMYLSYKFHKDLSDASSIGIIGGADGPTTIFVSGSQYTPTINAIFTLLSVIGILYLILTRRNKHNKNLKS
jgi:Na+-transporting methylmalonyl-CoA/oxaloacetate decarboxylase beta subunit